MTNGSLHLTRGHNPSLGYLKMEGSLEDDWGCQRHDRKANISYSSNNNDHNEDNYQQITGISVPAPVLLSTAHLGSHHISPPPPPPCKKIIDIEKAQQIDSETKLFFDAQSQILFANATDLLIPSASREKKHQHEHQCKQRSLTFRPRQYIRIIRHLRYICFNAYRRLFTFVFLLNGIGLYILVRQWTSQAKQMVILDRIATLASSNFLLAVFIRQDYLISLFFRAAWMVPWYVPLSIRKRVARIYCYGGIHSGAAVAGTAWWFSFTMILGLKCLQAGHYKLLVLIFTWTILGLLLIILFLSLPSIRAKYHDAFEMMHRFLGWAVVLLFWIQLSFMTSYRSNISNTIFRHALIRAPAFWNLLAITVLLIYPWLHLRRWTFMAHPLSSHALRLSFMHSTPRFSCLSISLAPLRQWHPFATFPCNNNNNDAASSNANMIISSAGDWTTRLVRHAAKLQEIQMSITTRHGVVSPSPFQMTFWVKSHPKPGVLSLSCLFPRVIILTTGSGIGPSLSSLLDKPQTQFARLIWSARTPIQTYGKYMMQLVHQADPEALIIDSNQTGRPDLLNIAWRMFTKWHAEAIFVLSNRNATEKVVGELERRGVPAFGPIWDS